MKSEYDTAKAEVLLPAFSHPGAGAAGMDGIYGRRKGTSAASPPDADLVTCVLPFPVLRRDLGAELSLFVIQAKSRPCAIPFHCPAKNVPLEFIYGLRGTADIRFSGTDNNMLPFRLGGGSCLTAYLPNAEGKLSFHAGAALQAVVLQVQPAFLLKLRASDSLRRHFFLRDIARHPHRPRIEAASLPFALHILLQQICGYGADGVLSHIFLSGKKYEIFYKQLELNAPPTALPCSISRDEYLAVSKVYGQLRAQIAYSPNLAELAASAGVSRSRLTALFRSLFGDTVFGVLRRERLACACQMLDEAPEKNLTEIAYLCGFSSSAHFTKSFSALYGVTPREYRRCYRQP
jgi:AraC-like DNA-binding protein